MEQKEHEKEIHEHSHEHTGEKSHEHAHETAHEHGHEHPHEHKHEEHSHAHDHVSHKKKININLILISLLLITLIITTVLTVNLYVNFNKKFSGTTTTTKTEKVNLINIKDSSCKDCSDLSPLVTEVVKLGISIGDEKDIDYKDASNLIKKYNITKIPTIIFSKEIASYKNSQLEAAWTQLGSIEKDGSYVLRYIPPPYKDTATSQINGLVEATYIEDKSCTKCFNSTIYKQILYNLGVFVNKENIYDSSSIDGQNLIKKYNINALPTMILSNEASEYKTLDSTWSQVGTVDSDGSYVIRKVSVLNLPYKDLINNTVVEPAVQTAG